MGAESTGLRKKTCRASASADSVHVRDGANSPEVPAPPRFASLLALPSILLSASLFAACDDDSIADGGVDAEAGVDPPDAADARDAGDATLARDASDGSTDAKTPEPDAGGDGGQRPLPRERASVFFVGHSLVNFDMPAMLDDIAKSMGVDHRYAAQIGVGAPLHWIWDHPETTNGDNAHTELPTGHYDVLVLTELIPFPEHVMYSETAEYLRRFYELAMSGNPQTQVYFYETWYDVNDPEWSANIAADRALWEQVVDDVNARVDGPDILLVPGGTAMARLVERIDAGELPGLESRFDLYTDAIHLTDIGNYFIALVQFAVIYRRSPVGATYTTHDRYGRPFDVPDPEAARVMQEVAWEVVSEDPRTGVAP